MTDLKTLKDMKVLSNNPMFNIGADEQSNWIKLEAVNWVKFISNGMKSVDDLMWEKLTGNTIIYDEKTRECICVFIKHFFNLTEEDLK